MKSIDKDFFIDPINNPDYSISGFWFWNDLITDDKTKEQLNIMKRIHANQPVVHSRHGLVNEYLSEDWFDRIQSVIDVCKVNKQKIWLYDEDNWPSGNCSWTITKDEKYREHFLQFEIKYIDIDGEYKIVLSEKNYINITAYLANGNAVNLMELRDDDLIIYKAKERATIYAIYIAVDDYEPIGKLNVDYLSKEAIREFIKTTHEKYKEHFKEYFGNIISGIFMDETRFCNAMPWTDTLPEEFKKRKGYDIAPMIPLLVRDEEDSAYVRFDYYDVISDMYTEATFKQVYEWCEKNNLKTIGHFLGEETLATQSYFGADMMRGYKYFHVPGIDHLGNGIGSLNGKFAVSACRNYGISRIACEAFGASGWDITFEDMVRISNWLFQQGINFIIMHGFYYSIKGERYNDFPPSYFYQWRYWDDMPRYVKMANRMMNLLSDGIHETEILVYSPMETFWCYFEPDLETKTGFWREGPWIKNDRAKLIDKEFQLICNQFCDKNLDYNILNSDAAENFIVEQNCLVNKITGERFSILVLPLTEVMTDNMINLISEFSKNGGIIINYKSDIKKIVYKNGDHFRKQMISLTGKMNCLYAKELKEIVVICEDKVELPFEIIEGTNKMTRSLSSYPDRLIDPYIHDNERVYGIGVSRYIKNNKRIINLTNYNDKDEAITIKVKSNDIPEVFIPETGEIIRLSEYNKQRYEYTFSIIIPANRVYFIVCQM